ALLRVCVVGAAFALALRCALSMAGATDVVLTVFTLCRLDSLLVGAALALAVREMGLARVGRMGRRMLAPLAALIFLASAWNAATSGLLREVVLPVRTALVA